VLILRIEARKMKIATYTLVISLVPSLVHCQTAAGDRLLTTQFEEMAKNVADLFDRATAMPDSVLLPQITDHFDQLLKFEERLQAVRQDRFTRGGDDQWTKTMSLLQQACMVLDFTLDALGEWISTRDPNFLTLAVQGREILCLAKKLMAAGASSVSTRTASTPTGRGAVPQLSESRMPIQDAENAGFVRTSYKNLTGNSSGDTVLLVVVKTGGPARLVLTVPTGLFLKNPSPTSQDMIIAGLKGREAGPGKYTPTSTITLTDNQPAQYVVEAYCAEFHKDNPPAGQPFAIGTSFDPGMVCVLNEARSQGLSVAATQAAVWIRAEHVTFSEMNTEMPVGLTEWSRSEAVVSRCASR
jgi:hypothetical protein